MFASPVDGVLLSPQALALTGLPGDQQLQKHAEILVKRSLRKVPHGSNRHITNARVQSQKPGDGPARKRVNAHYDGSPVVVIAFEGTGSFDARRPAVMQEMGRELQSKGHDTTDPRFQPDRLVDDALTKVRGKGANWSGLSTGPLNEIVRDPELNNGVQWLSFPSEEAEILSDKEAYKDLDPLRLIRDIKRSSSGTSQGIDAALRRVQEIAGAAKKQGKSPKFVLMSHSSGGRSAVKFAEKLKRLRNPATGQNYQVDLALTIDPVIEAHEVILDAGREVLNKKTEQLGNSLRDFLGLAKKKVYPPNIGSSRKPGVLFRPENVKEWINFYQRTDTEGLKMPIRFGIHGNPVVGAVNTEITDTKTDGHGAIAYHPQVLRRVKSALRELIRR